MLVGPDGDSVVAVSTGLGAARGNFISKMAGVEAAKDGIPSTRNSPYVSSCLFAGPLFL